MPEGTRQHWERWAEGRDAGSIEEGGAQESESRKGQQKITIHLVKTHKAQKNEEDYMCKKREDAIAESIFSPPPPIFLLSASLPPHFLSPHACTPPTCPLHSPTEEFGFLEGVGCLQCHN